MKSFNIGLVLAVLTLLCPAISWGDWVTVLFDDFDDGDYSGWSVTFPGTHPASPPDIVPSPEGYSLRGVGSGYSMDPGLHARISKPIALTSAMEIQVEFRAKSGPQWPNVAKVYLFSGEDFYCLFDQGESQQAAFFMTYLHPGPGEYSSFVSITANDWHDFSWIRDTNGWWSLSIDNTEVAHNLLQDDRLLSFDLFGVEVLRNQTEIEWVRVSIPEPAVPTDPPIAEAGDNLVADANEIVTLDASASYDPDGRIIQYTWKRLPDGVVIYSGKEPNCPTRALGRVEEVIELTVTDDYWTTATDTVRIVSRTAQDLKDQVAAMQSQIEQLQQQNQELRELVDKIASFPSIREWLRRLDK